MRNVEYKAELRDPAAARATCRALGAAHLITLRQTDTYFRVPSGRLKRRETPGEPTEWIFYERPDRVDVTTSAFTIYTEAGARAQFGASDPPTRVVVRKRRELHMLDGVRIHLDEVESLGTFFELEALVTPRQDHPAARALIEMLVERFRSVLGEPIAVSYGDLLASEQDEGGTA